jgi:hypothetical protein
MLSISIIRKMPKNVSFEDINPEKSAEFYWCSKKRRMLYDLYIKIASLARSYRENRFLR